MSSKLSSSVPTQQREYAEGLEVVPPPHGLETVPVPEGLEVPVSSDPEWHGREAGNDGVKVDGEHDNRRFPHDTPPKPWWKKKRFLIGVALAVVLAVALSVGLGIGLVSNRFVSLPLPPLIQVKVSC